MLLLGFDACVLMLLVLCGGVLVVCALLVLLVCSLAIGGFGCVYVMVVCGV